MSCIRTETYDGSSGQETSYTYIASGGDVIACTYWRDVATSDSVKENITIVVSGTPPTTGYPVSREIELESTSF